VPRPRRLGAGFSPRSLWIIPVYFTWNSLWTKWYWSKVYSQFLRVYPADQHSTIVAYSFVTSPRAHDYILGYIWGFSSYPALGWLQGRKLEKDMRGIRERKITKVGETKPNSVASVHERAIPTERPPLAGEVSANFCG
jgi:hypothetical protein